MIFRRTYQKIQVTLPLVFCSIYMVHRYSLFSIVGSVTYMVFDFVEHILYTFTLYIVPQNQFVALKWKRTYPMIGACSRYLSRAENPTNSAKSSNPIAASP